MAEVNGVLGPIDPSQLGFTLQRIAESHPALGEHLAATVRRG